MGAGGRPDLGLAAPVCTPLTPLPVRPSAASPTACAPQTAVHLAATPTPADAPTAATSASQSTSPPAWLWAMIAAAVLAAGAVLFLRHYRVKP